jgi:hypothetical protein
MTRDRKELTIPCDGCGKSSTRRAFRFGSPTRFLCDSCEPNDAPWCPDCRTFHTGARPGTKTTVPECPLQRSLAERLYGS